MAVKSRSLFISSLLLLLSFSLSALPSARHQTYNLSVNQHGLLDLEIPLEIPRSDEMLSPDLTLRHSYRTTHSVTGVDLSFNSLDDLVRCKRTPEPFAKSIEGFCYKGDFYQLIRSNDEPYNLLVPVNMWADKKSLNLLQFEDNGDPIVKTRSGKLIRFSYGYGPEGHGTKDRENVGTMGWKISEVSDASNKSYINYCLAPLSKDKLIPRFT